MTDDTTQHSAPARSPGAGSLPTTVAERLRAAIAARGRRLLAVSGGSTPKLFFEVLSRATSTGPR